jgi:hypothetical protein
MFAAIMYLVILFVVIGVAALLMLTGPKGKPRAGSPSDSSDFPPQAVDQPRARESSGDDAARGE